MVVGVNNDFDLAEGETEATLTMFTNQTQVTFPIGLDAAQSYRNFVSRDADGETLSPYPLDVIIAPDGTIAYINTEFDSDAITRVIESLRPSPKR